MVEEKIKEGYKETEIGIIPEDWEVVKLSEVINKKPEYGINSAAVPYKESLPTYLRITDISEDGNFIYTNKVSVYNDKAENFYLHKYDIVFARTGASTGKTYLYKESDGKLVFAGFLIRVNINNKYMDARFIKAFTETKRYWNWVTIMSMRSGQPGINGNEYSQLKLPMPSLKEQYAIADVISDINILLQSLEKLIDKKKKIKQGTMQQLLTGKKRLPGFSQEWTKCKISDIAVVGRGRVISHKEIFNSLNKIYPVYSSQTTNRGIMGCIDTYDFEGDYITWTTDGVNAGKVFYRSGRFNCTNVCGTIKLKTDDHTFVAMALDNVTDKYVSKNLANPKLMNDVMKRIEIKLPNINEQKAIAKVILDITSEIEALEQKLEKYKKVKQGMMQELLTGRIRLI
jgi:type I restriction enzyme S subunit